MRWLALVMLASCHASAGPVLAYAPEYGLRVGGELSGGFGFVRGSTGTTIGTCPRARAPRAYLTLEPGYFLPMSQPESALVTGGATLGIATSDSDEAGAALGAWSATSFATDACVGHNRFMPSVAIGFRYLGGVGEVYITPKAGMLFQSCHVE